MTVTDLPLATGPVSAPPRWSGTAACAGVTDAELFFPEDEDGDTAQVAKAICAGCPVRAQCLAYGLGNAMQAGIWGGLSTAERTALLRARRADARRGA